MKWFPASLGVVAALSTVMLFSQPVWAQDQDAVAFIAHQVQKCWTFDLGKSDAADLVVKVHVLLKADGSAVAVDVVDDPRLQSSVDYRRVAIGARRAVFACSPFHLPQGKYDAVKDIVLTFDPRDSLR